MSIFIDEYCNDIIDAKRYDIMLNERSKEEKAARRQDKIDSKNEEDNRKNFINSATQYFKNIAFENEFDNVTIIGGKIKSGGTETTKIKENEQFIKSKSNDFIIVPVPRSSNKVDNSAGDNASLSGFIRYCIKNRTSIMQDFNESGYKYKIEDITVSTTNLSSTNGGRVALAVLYNPLFAIGANSKTNVDCLRIRVSRV